MTDYPRHHPKKLDQMRRRHEQTGSIRKVAEEFDLSKSHAHRLLKQDEDDPEAKRD